MTVRYRLPALVAAALLLPALASAQANVYRWVDKDGKVQYSDTPPPQSQKELQQKRMGGGLRGIDAAALCDAGRRAASRR